MNKNTKQTDFDKIYTSEYDRVYAELSNKVISTITNPSKNTLLFKQNLLVEEFKDTLNEMTLKELEPNVCLADEYTERLLNSFKIHLNDYVENNITNFINDHLENIKKNFEGSNLQIPSNIKMDAQQTVEFIAKYDALKTIILKMSSIERNDTIDICEKKISMEGYLPPQTEAVVDNFEKIQWQGTQKELGELFVELYKKGWISSIDDKLIAAYFTNSNTIFQVVKKGEMDKIKKEYPYENIYTKKYSKKFDGIKLNKTKMK